MSPKTKEHVCKQEGKIAGLDTNMINVMKFLEEIRTDVKDLKNDLSDFVTRYEQEKQEIIKEITKYANKNFASKWTERILIFVGGIIGTALVTAILSLILK